MPVGEREERKVDAQKKRCGFVLAELGQDGGDGHVGSRWTVSTWPKRPTGARVSGSRSKDVGMTTDALYSVWCSETEAAQNEPFYLSISFREEVAKMPEIAEGTCHPSDQIR